MDLNKPNGMREGRSQIVEYVVEIEVLGDVVLIPSSHDDYENLQCLFQ